MKLFFLLSFTSLFVFAKGQSIKPVVTVIGPDTVYSGLQYIIKLKGLDDDSAIIFTSQPHSYISLVHRSRDLKKQFGSSLDYPSVLIQGNSGNFDGHSGFQNGSSILLFGLKMNEYFWDTVFSKKFVFKDNSYELFAQSENANNPFSWKVKIGDIELFPNGQEKQENAISKKKLLKNIRKEISLQNVNGLTDTLKYLRTTKITYYVPGHTGSLVAVYTYDGDDFTQIKEPDIKELKRILRKSKYGTVEFVVTGYNKNNGILFDYLNRAIRFKK